MGAALCVVRSGGPPVLLRVGSLARGRTRGFDPSGDRHAGTGQPATTEMDDRVHVSDADWYRICAAAVLSVGWARARCAGPNRSCDRWRRYSVLPASRTSFLMGLLTRIASQPARAPNLGVYCPRRRPCFVARAVVGGCRT